MHKRNHTILATLSAMLLLASSVAHAQTAPAAATAMPASPAAASASTAPAAATAKAGQAQFTTAINNREPADNVTTLDNSHGEVYFFTVLEGAAGQTITHRWTFNGKTMAEVKLEPKANHWRAWSSKSLMPDQTGTWTVDVVDGSGNVLMSKSFNYIQAPAAAPNATHKVQPNATHKVPAAQQSSMPAPPSATQVTPPASQQ